jgi:ABC-type branched-subunit amino acid transport system substrate-binding protein
MQRHPLLYIRALLGLAVLFWRVQPSAEPIKIAVVTDSSGKMAEFGKQTFLGAQMAEAELKGRGEEVRVLYEDSAMDTGQALSAATKAITIDKVGAIYAEFTPIAMVLAPLAKKSNKLMIYRSGSNSIVNVGPTIFKTYFDFKAGCRLVAQHFLRRGFKRISILRLDMEPGQLCYEGLVQEVPPHSDQVFNSGERLNTHVLKAKQSASEALIVMGYEPDLLSVMKAMQDLDFKIPLGTVESAVSQKVLKEFPALSENLRIFGMPPVDSEFVARVRQQNPENSLVHIDAVASAYVHVHQLFRILKRCGSQHVNCQLQELKNSAPEKIIRFKGWRGQLADFPPVLRYWKSGEEHLLH